MDFFFFAIYGVWKCSLTLVPNPITGLHQYPVTVFLRLLYVHILLVGFRESKYSDRGSVVPALSFWIQTHTYIRLLCEYHQTNRVDIFPSTHEWPERYFAQHNKGTGQHKMWCAFRNPLTIIFLSVTTSSEYVANRCYDPFASITRSSSPVCMHLYVA